MKEIVADAKLVAYCGLYCGACKAYRLGSCPGCREKKKANWCKPRTCCLEHQYATCADCTRYENPRDCKIYNDFIAKLFGYLFRSNRAECICRIRRFGLDHFAADMAESGRHTIRIRKRAKRP